MKFLCGVVPSSNKKFEQIIVRYGIIILDFVFQILMIMLCKSANISFF
jgi:hypothetical protein